MRHDRKTCGRLCAKVEYTPGSGPVEGTAGRVSIHQVGAALKLRKATEYPLDVKDDSDLCHRARPSTQAHKLQPLHKRLSANGSVTRNAHLHHF
ncbi:hypothetical protein C4K38_5019 [Pseudomonas chlororaphis subsp. piscium]|nr:hypothetical protein C4K38_5019 [Pseudomonas chlororaphis subsp. piscium]AZC83917.1 hypothetical protein C4K30_4825 [Pseudomonas chlororaphis subsp. piscium]AZC97530.1 hypothetical protein C4K28_4824 [Pseudomonas chlororaphis subsp. piscium]